MPLPQVSTRLKEIPAQALRVVFAGIGQMLLAVDKVRARAVEQMSSSAHAPASKSLDQAKEATPPTPARAAPPPAAAAPPESAESVPDGPRWRSLDETGNVRVLNADGVEEEEDEEGREQSPSQPPAAAAEPAEAAPPVASVPPVVPEPPAVPEPAPVPEPASASEPAPAPAPAPAAPAPAAPAPAAPAPAAPEPAAAEPAAAELAAAEPAAAEPAVPAVPAGASAPGAAILPVPNYDQATVASLRARLRVLDTGQVRVLLDYEKAHEGRAAVISMFERRLAKLEGSD